MMPTVERLPDAARMLGYLGTTGDFGALASRTIAPMPPARSLPTPRTPRARNRQPDEISINAKRLSTCARYSTISPTTSRSPSDPWHARCSAVAGTSSPPSPPAPPSTSPASPPNSRSHPRRGALPHCGPPSVDHLGHFNPCRVGGRGPPTTRSSRSVIPSAAGVLRTGRQARQSSGRLRLPEVGTVVARPGWSVAERATREPGHSTRGRGRSDQPAYASSGRSGPQSGRRYDASEHQYQGIAT